MIVYTGKQMHVVHNLPPRDGTGFLAAFAHDFLHGEHIADLFHQFDTAGQRQVPRIALGERFFQSLYGFFYHFLCVFIIPSCPAAPASASLILRIFRLLCPKEHIEVRLFRSFRIGMSHDAVLAVMVHVPVISYRQLVYLVINRLFVQ